MERQREAIVTVQEVPPSFLLNEHVLEEASSDSPLRGRLVFYDAEGIFRAAGPQSTV